MMLEKVFRGYDGDGGEQGIGNDNCDNMQV